MYLKYGKISYYKLGTNGKWGYIMTNLLNAILTVENMSVLLRSGNGDDTPIALFIVLMIVSAATLVLLAVKKKKK